MEKELNKEFTTIENTNYGINEYGEVKSYLTGKVLKPFLISGYPAVNISIDGKRKTVYIHHLISSTFLGHVPKRGMLSINHIDHDKTNNRLDNLEIITHRRNTALFYIYRNREFPTGVTSNGSGKHKYKAQINYKKKVTYLGSYETVEEAHAAYIEASESIIKNGCIPERFLTRKRYERFRK